MTCERCGCTEERACEIELEEGEPVMPCWWVRPGLCAGCVGPADLDDPAVAAALELAPPPFASVLESPAPPAPLLYDAYGRAVR